MKNILLLLILLPVFNLQSQIYSTKKERIQQADYSPKFTFSAGGVFGDRTGAQLGIFYVHRHTFVIGLQYSGSGRLVKEVQEKEQLASIGLSGYYILNTRFKSVRFMVGGSLNKEAWQYPLGIRTINSYILGSYSYMAWERKNYNTFSVSPAVDIALEKWLGIRIRPEYVWAPYNRRFQLNVSLIFGNVKDYRKK